MAFLSVRWFGCVHVQKKKKKEGENEYGHIPGTADGLNSGQTEKQKERTSVWKRYDKCFQ